MAPGKKLTVVAATMVAPDGLMVNRDQLCQALPWRPTTRSTRRP